VELGVSGDAFSIAFIRRPIDPESTRMVPSLRRKPKGIRLLALVPQIVLPGAAFCWERGRLVRIPLEGIPQEK
jgi:hypothetical protein